MKRLTRPQRAMQLTMQTWTTWRACPGGVSVPSQSVKGRKYTVTETTCTCNDATWRGATCKHQLGLRLAIARYDSRQRAAGRS
jgi:hypothetical protein